MIFVLTALVFSADSVLLVINEKRERHRLMLAMPFSYSWLVLCFPYSSGSIITVMWLPSLLNSFMKAQMSAGVMALRVFM